jgi:hypothetical protein
MLQPRLTRKDTETMADNATATVQLIPVSGNRKTGPLPVSSSQSSTCPPACGAFYDCYAKFHHCKRHWQRLDAGEAGNAHSWGDFCREVKRMPKGQLWRCNEKGDLPGQGNEIDSGALTQLVKSNKGRNGFSYTHKPVFAGTYTVTGNADQRHTSEVSEATASANREAIAAANAGGFTVNLSADSLSDADRKAGLGIGPVCVVLPSDAAAGKRYATPEGRKVVTCPAALDRNKGRGITCARCALCQRGERSFVIGFPAHGSGKKRASLKVVA